MSEQNYKLDHEFAVVAANDYSVETSKRAVGLTLSSFHSRRKQKIQL